MNFLAHAYLAGDSPDLLLGNLMGDFVRGRINPALPAEIRMGLLHHRQIDSFTDTHPVAHQSARHLRPRWRHFAPLLVDIFYDHFLASDWSSYHPQPLRDFADHVYQILESHRERLGPEVENLSPRLRRGIRSMIDQDWLVTYSTKDGIELTLSRLSTRIRRPGIDLAPAVEDLRRHEAPLRREFAAFFPQVVRFSAGLQSESPPNK